MAPGRVWVSGLMGKRARVACALCERCAALLRGVPISEFDGARARQENVGTCSRCRCRRSLFLVGWLLAAGEREQVRRSALVIRLSCCFAVAGKLAAQPAGSVRDADAAVAAVTHGRKQRILHEKRAPLRNVSEWGSK